MKLQPKEKNESKKELLAKKIDRQMRVTFKRCMAEMLYHGEKE